MHGADDSEPFNTILLKVNVFLYSTCLSQNRENSCASTDVLRVVDQMQTVITLGLLVTLLEVYGQR